MAEPFAMNTTRETEQHTCTVSRRCSPTYIDCHSELSQTTCGAACTAEVSNWQKRPKLRSRKARIRMAGLGRKAKARVARGGPGLGSARAYSQSREPAIQCRCC